MMYGLTDRRTFGHIELLSQLIIGGVSRNIFGLLYNRNESLENIFSPVAPDRSRKTLNDSSRTYS